MNETLGYFWSLIDDLYFNNEMGFFCWVIIGVSVLWTLYAAYYRGYEWGRVFAYVAIVPPLVGIVAYVILGQFDPLWRMVLFSYGLAYFWSVVAYIIGAIVMAVASAFLHP